MAIELIDSYTPVSTSGYVIRSVGGYQRAGQVFLAPKDFTLSSVILSLKTSAVGSAFCIIYLITGTGGTNGTPTGSALATSDSFDTSTLGSSYAENTFTFSGANLISMTKDTWYAIELYAWINPGFSLNVLASGGTHAGNPFTMLASSSLYVASSTKDVYFKIYGDVVSNRLLSSGVRAAIRSRTR